MKLAKGTAHQPEALDIGLYTAGIGKISPSSEDVRAIVDLPVHVLGGDLYFCRMGNFQCEPITNVHHLEGQLGRFVPEGVVLLEGADSVVAEDGRYTLASVTVELNGSKKVIFTEETLLIPELVVDNDELDENLFNAW